MSTHSVHKNAHARFLKFAQDIGWIVVSRDEAEHQRSYGPDAPSEDRPKGVSLFFDNLLDTQVRKFIPHCAETEGAFLNQFHHFHIHTNRSPVLVSECKNAHKDETITQQIEFL